VRAALRQNQDLVRNAGSLAATTGITSVLGFAFWIYAAHVFTPAEVGYGTAAISAITLIGTIGMFGIGTMLIGELPHRELERQARGGLIMAGLIASFTGTLILGLGFAFISLVFEKHFPEVGGTLGRMVLFAVGAAITGATLVFDEATIGLMRGGLQLNRNIAVSVAKMVALPACAIILHDIFGVGIILAYVLGTIISLLPVAVMIKRSGSSVLYRPDWEAFWRLGRLTLSHNWLNLAIVVPTKILPVLVVIVVSPSSNAAFYIATMLASFLYMIPIHLSTVLFAIAASKPELIPEKLRFVLRMALLIGIPGGLILGLTSPYILSFYGSSYAHLAVGPLWIIILQYLPQIPNTVYVSVCRATGRINRATVFLTAGAIVQCVAILIGGKLAGLYGLCFALLGVEALQAIVTTPPVLRAAFDHSVVRAAETIAAPAVDTPAADSLRLRQEAGLAALFAIATPVDPNGYSRDVLVQEDGLAALVSLATTVDPRRHRQAATADHVALTRPSPRLVPSAPRSPGHDSGHHRLRRTALRPTVAQPVLSETSQWPENFRNRQESGVAALIAIATHAARY
jgi:O-antigen/teichoic acid export membrane protein